MAFWGYNPAIDDNGWMKGDADDFVPQLRKRLSSGFNTLVTLLRVLRMF